MARGTGLGTEGRVVKMQGLVGDRNVAYTIADVRFGIAGDHEYCDRPRIFVPD